MALPTSTQTVTKTIPSYLYFQYLDDQNVPALITAYNESTQAYLDWFNGVNLPNYTLLSGRLLDWVGAGLYGMPRPNFSYEVTESLVGAVATAPNTSVYTGFIRITAASWASSTVTLTLASPIAGAPIGSSVSIVVSNMKPTGYNGSYNATVISTYQITYPLASNPGAVTVKGIVTAESTFTPLALTTAAIPSATSNIVVTDDIYKRILTWNFYKGDGMQWSIPWFKRRVHRFLNGPDGVDTPIAFTQDVSVTFPTGTSPQEILVGIYTSDLQTGEIFAAALQYGVLNVPFRFKFVVTVSEFPKLHLDNAFTPLDQSVLA